MNVTLLLFSSLSAYRLARMVTQEDGPADVFSWLRQRVGQTTWVGRGVHCMACMTVWSALLVVLALALLGDVWWVDVPLLWGATAGGAFVIYQVFR